MDSAAAAPNPSTAEEEIAGTGQYKARCLNQADLPEVLKLLPPPPTPHPDLQSLPSPLPHKSNPQNHVQSSAIKEAVLRGKNKQSLLLWLIVFPRPA